MKKLIALLILLPSLVSGATQKTVSDVDLVTLCLLGEARCQQDNDYAGMRAISQVILTRSRNRQISITEVITQPYQFSCLNQGINALTTRSRALMAESPAATNAAKTFALAILNNIDTMPNLTADHYYAHHICSPKWAKPKYALDVTQIQDHTFLRLK